MQATLKIDNILKTIDLSTPLDISIPLSADESNPLAWYLSKPEIVPVKDGDWVGSVKNGASVNFNTIQFNPHAHGTHTECVGHISSNFYAINASLTTFFFTAQVVSIVPVQQGEDFIITKKQLVQALGNHRPQAIVIRTLPNTSAKTTKKYSHTNWPYLAEDAALYLREINIQHLLIDLPSVDKEKDAGALKAHKAFWNYPNHPRVDATITEFIFVPNKIKDGSYLLNLQVSNFVNDAAPSRPVLYAFT